MSYENWTMEKSRIWGSGESPEEVADRQAALEEYAQVAAWCNENQQYIIVEDENLYKTVKVENEDLAESEEKNGDLA